jgi:4-hydroxybenzoate polyprenyltransferase
MFELRYFSVCLLSTMIIALLRNPHAFGLTIALLTAILTFLYAKTTEKDNPSAPTKVFWKTLVAGAISALVLAWVVHRPEQMLREPFSDMPPMQTSSLTTTPPGLA